MARRKKSSPVDYVWAVSRISIGFVFLWAFFDKLIGLGFSTCRGGDGAINTLCDSSWLKGGAPTEGYLNFATKGPFGDTFQSLAGNSFIDLVFMTGLLAVGIGLIFGVAMKLSVWSGVTMLLLIWLSALWPENNPFMDDHLIYAFVLVGILMVNDRQVLGLGHWWSKLDFVKEYPVLQ